MKKKRKKKASKWKALYQFYGKAVFIGGGALMVAILLTRYFWFSVPKSDKDRTEGTILTSLDDSTSSRPKPPDELPDPATFLPQKNLPIANLPVVPTDYTNAVGVALPHEAYLVASQNGPFVVGHAFPPEQINLAVTKVLPPPDSPEKLAKLTPYDSIDLRTGKSIGKFEIPYIRPFDKLSPDGTRLLGQIMKDGKYTGELVVYQIGNPKPIMNWKMPTGAFGYEFIGNDRVAALILINQLRKITILDVTTSKVALEIPIETGTSVPADPRFYANYFMVESPVTAVSPDGKFVAFVPNETILWIHSTVDGAEIAKFSLNDKLASFLPAYTGKIASRNWLNAIRFDETGKTLHVAWSPMREKLVNDEIEVMFLLNYDLAANEVISCNALKRQTNGPLEICAGPEPDTIVLGTRIIDWKRGIDLAPSMKGIFAKVSPKEFLARTRTRNVVNEAELSVRDNVPIDHVVGRVKFDRDAFQRLAETARNQFAKIQENDPEKLPNLIDIDRSETKVIALQAKPKWSVVARAVTPVAPLVFHSQSASATHGLTEAAEIAPGSIWHRIDMTTGLKLGSPIELDTRPNKINNNQLSSAKEAKPTAALSNDGSKLAVAVHNEQTRLHIWDNSGRMLFAFQPNGPNPIKNDFIWTDTGRLLTSSNTKISCWDTEKKKLVYEIPGVFASMKYVPFKHWLMLSTNAGTLEFFDPDTGTHLGRIPFPAENTPAISPDGKMLFRTFARHDDRINRTRAHLYWVEVWDLTTGKRSLDTEVPKGQIGTVWVTNRRTICKQDKTYLLYDFDLHTHTISYTTDREWHVYSDRFGRSWISTDEGRAEKTIHRSLKVPDDGAFQGEFVFGPQSAISFDVNIGHAELNKRIALNTAKTMQDRGKKIAPGGFVLKATHSQETHQIRLTNTQTATDYESTLPTHVFTWKLVDADGVEVWKESAKYDFSPFKSKFRMKDPYRQPVEITYDGRPVDRARLDYNGRDPLTCQIEEALEWNSDMPNGYIGNLPEFLMKTPAGYVALPISKPLILQK